MTVWLVGQLGVGEVEKNKRTRNFTSEDVEILDGILQQFFAIITTPHILTETTNLLDWVTGENRTKLWQMLAIFIQKTEEIYVPASEAVLSPIFYRLGLSDSVLYALCEQRDFVLLTADLDLYGYTVGQKLPAINFNHLRNL